MHRHGHEMNRPHLVENHMATPLSADNPAGAFQRPKEIPGADSWQALTQPLR